MLSIVIMLCVILGRMKLIVVLDNVRSAHNVGSIFRTAEAAAVIELILIGLTPQPYQPNDPRPAYVADRATAQIAKTALGAETMEPWQHFNTVDDAFVYLHHNHYMTAALELAENAEDLFGYLAPERLALIVGHETMGISAATRSKTDVTLAIPMAGQKESLNVSVAAGIAIYQLSCGNQR